MTTTRQRAGSRTRDVWAGLGAGAAVVLALGGAGCGPRGGTDATGPGPDGGGTSTDAVAAGTDAGPPCGTELLPTTAITGTEGIAIGPTGTLYYSQFRAVGRRIPGGAPDGTWVSISGADTIWGLALSPDGILYVGSPSTGTLYAIDTNAASPVASSIVPVAGTPNGLTMGPDGAVYYGDFNTGQVYRVTPAGVRTQVTTSPVPSANGLLFDPDGTLLVLNYGGGTIWRLTLDASMVETGRVMAGDAGGAMIDGIGRDAMGRYYVTDNSGDRLLRFDASFGNQTPLLTGIGAAANVAFGKGALACTDVYVASSGALGLFHGDSAGTP
ncbi:MAG TPA: SMP-30/gluconolactonase/LRE family protein [Myxococcota bacterium]|jgi:sugar lactone lactonase YvrE|nr:SMP-30/gluconolactonase/LRE family protein [Myxococcota bacterium]